MPVNCKKHFKRSRAVVTDHARHDSQNKADGLFSVCRFGGVHDLG